jgi:subtilase family serine protease
MNLAVGLPLRNQAELENLLKQIVDPSSPNFRQYLTPAEFAARFGPTEADYQALAAFFEANGLSVSGTHANRTILDVSGTVADIDSTFHVHMTYWNHRTRGTFFAPDREPSVDAGVTILDISGLDNFVVPRPMDFKSRPLTAGAIPLTTGSGPSGLFTGGDFRAAYAPAVTLNGAGQSVGLFELDGFYPADVAANFTQAGLPAVPTKTVLLDGFNGAPGSGSIEVTLDIMMAAYMAPGVTDIIVYEGTNPNDVLNRMATDNLASQLSSSWGWSPTNASTEQIFKQMVAQGQSLFQASGDSGAYTGGIMPPADDPNLTVVGGTSLTTAGPGGAWESETTWPESGGGVSTTWPIPSYQQPAAMTAAGGSGSMRNIPDVSLLADIQIFLICNNGQWIEVGGTSAAAPLWAGFLALANQQAAASNNSRVGFLNPLIYPIGAGANYDSDLHDITTGNDGGFNALVGYDLATGWGTPNGQPLINSLTGATGAASFSLSAPGTLSISPGSSGSGVVTISPQQGFSGAVKLAASGLPTGVTASFSPASATTSSTLTLTTTASAAAATSTITITGVSGSLTSTARLTLTISAPASFTLSATPASLSLTQGGSLTSTIAINSQNGFDGSVTLAASGLPSGVTAVFGASAAGSSTLTLTATNSATAGTSTVTFTGTSGSLHGTAKIALTVSVAQGYTIAASPASLNVPQGGSAVSTITVAPKGGFNGTVTLSAIGLPAGVTATFLQTATHTSMLTLSALGTATPGPSTITITGTSGTITNAASITITVAAPPSFTLSATPASVSVNAGASGTSSIAITAVNGFSGAVALTASGLPAGVTAAFGPLVGHTRAVTFTAAGSAAAATATVTITGVSGALTSSTAIALTIALPPTFTLSASPTALSVQKGASGSSTLSLSPQNGFNSTVTVSVSGLPTGVVGSFSAGATPATATLTLTASASAAAGTWTVTVIGKSGSLTKTAAISLTVTAASAAAGKVNLASSFNVMGVVTDGAKFLSSSGLDGGGRAYSSNLLGNAQTANGMPFSFGSPNTPGAVNSATIALPAGNFSTLNLLATGVNGAQLSQPFTVTYTDGTTSTFTQSLSDWCVPQGYAGESNAVLMAYRDNSDGTRDTRPMTLYGYSFNLSSAKTVKSIKLPNNRNVVVLSMSLGSATSSAKANQQEATETFNKTHIVLVPAADRAKR